MVHIGNRPLGGEYPIRLQSMTNTNTTDVKTTLAQTIRIIEAGADYVRISAPNIQAAHKLKEIKAGLRAAGFSNPLIADIHFNPEVALLAARYVEKVRINPGNYIRGIPGKKTEYTKAEKEAELDMALERLKPLSDVCREHGTAIRIGTNMGSLSPRIVLHYGNTPEGMVMATFEFLQLFRELNFHNLVVSLKASKPMIMVQAYEQMVDKMLQNNMSYPLHIGITEAGESENGRIKSALGICNLLNKGIGDTLRVSLTEEPEKEIPFAEKISAKYQDDFTRKQDGFSLKKSDFSGNDIFFAGTKLKTVVVATDNEANKISSESKKDKIPQNSLHPDFIYTSNLSEPENYPDHKFLIDKKPVTAKLAENTWLLVNRYDLQKTWTPPAEKYFLQIDASAKVKSLPDNLFPLPDAVVYQTGNGDNGKSFEKLLDVSGRKRIPVIVRKSFNDTDPEQIVIETARQLSSYLLEQRIGGLWLGAPIPSESITDICFNFLQTSGLRVSRTEFISCPTCARTSFDLQRVLRKVQDHFSGIPGLKIAIMGCVVNGPGEMADADFGFVGTGAGKLHLYKNKTPLVKNISPENAVAKLTDILKEYGYIE